MERAVARLATPLHRGGGTMEAVDLVMRSRAWVFVAVIGASGLWASPARAVPLEFRADVFGGFMLRMPESVTLPKDGIEGDLRTVGGGAHVPVAGPLGYLGTRMSFGLAFGRHFVLRGIGFGAGGAVGPAPSTISAVAGTIVEAQPYRMAFWEADLIGVSLRGVHRRLAYELSASAGAMSVSLPVAASYGKDTVSVDTSASTPTLRVEAQACYRVDWTKRACFFAGVNLYQFGWLNGGHAGLRWEYGK